MCDGAAMDDPIEIHDSKALIVELKALEEFKPLKGKQKRFLLAYAGSGRISAAAAISKIPWITHYRWLQRLPEYKQAWEKSREIFSDYAEGEVFNRAFFGEDHKIFKKGELIEVYKQKSDILAMFALKGLKPQYRDNFAINNYSGPVQLNVQYATAPAETVLPTEDTKVIDDDHLK